MENTETRNQINQLLDQLPESQLTEVLGWLQANHAGANENQATSAHFLRILQEDRELLQKLAQ